MSPSGRSATYVAVLGDDGDLVTAIADMDSFDEISVEQAMKYGLVLCSFQRLLLTLVPLQCCRQLHACSGD